MEDRSVIPLPDDLTYGLDSLSFEKVFEENKAKYISELCYTSEIINITICMYAVYFVKALDAVKKAVVSREIYKETASKVPKKNLPGLRIGMIGCGILGQQIIRCLIYQNNIQPHNLFISTRDPGQLEEFKVKGITCMNNNFEVCKFAEILLIAIPPSQVSMLSNEIQDHLSKYCIVYSIVAGLDLQKLASMLKTENVYSLDITYNKETTVHLNWEQKKIPDFLSDEEIIKMFLPFRGSDSIAEDVCRLPAIITCAALNLSFAISSEAPEDVLSLVQSVIFGVLPLEEYEMFWIEDFDKGLSSSHIASVLKSKSNVASLLKKVKESRCLQEGFIKMFMQYCYTPAPKKQTEWHDIKRSLTID